MDSTIMRQASEEKEVSSDDGDGESKRRGGGGRNLVRKLFTAAKRRITASTSPGKSEIEEDELIALDPDDIERLPDNENSKLYAELAKRKAAVQAEQEVVKDKDIYDTLAAKTDFPRLAKKLNEALANRSLFQSASPLPSTFNTTAERLHDFEPSSGQSPGEVISGVLRALRDDGVKDDGTLEYGGVETLLKFTSSASSLGADESKNPVAIAQFFSKSEYSILLNWDNIVFPSPLRLSIDGTKAYYITKLRDAKTGDWQKVKWSLSLCDEDEKKDGKWLIDTIMVTRR